MRRRISRMNPLMIFAFLVLYAVPMLLIGLFIQPRLAVADRAKARLMYDATLTEAVTHISLIQSGIQNGARALADDVRLRQFDGMDAAARLTLVGDQFPAQLDALARSLGVSVMVTLYLDGLADTAANADESPAYAILPMEQAQREAWFTRFSEYPVMNAWMEVEADEGARDLCHLCGIWSPDGDRMVGLVTICLRADEMMTVLQEVVPTDGAIDVMLKNGRTILDVGTPLATGRPEVLLVKRSPDDAFVVSAHLSTAFLDQESQRVARGLRRFAALYTCLMLALAVIYTTVMSRRVLRIAKVVDQFAQGDYGMRILMPERNELSALVRSLNELMNTVEELLQREYYVKLRQKQTELRMLQAQINPHFLYNILGSIGNLALLGDGKRVNTITRALAMFYRMTFASGTGLISVRQEISQVSKYLDILKIQYQHRLDVVMEIDELVYPFGTPRFILQPFVENAVNHSWQNARLTLYIRARLNHRNVQLEVEDDGVGMDAETLHSIFKQSLERKHYGVTNVDERIKLQFGEGYGVSMTSRPMQGTRVVILIPQTRIESVIPHDQPPQR